MSKHLQTEVELLKRNALELTALVEDSLEKALRALKRRDEDLARLVIETDHHIDKKEVELEEDCLKVLALHQPVAIDLRTVIGILKMNNDLERIGDLAVNVAERAVFFAKEEPFKLPFDFDNMSVRTRAMLREAIDAFIKGDVLLARKVCSADDEVDAINRDVYKCVYDEIRRNPKDVEALIHCLSISRHLERIADYATNLAEDVIYMFEGNIVRHQPEEYRSLVERR